MEFSRVDIFVNPPSSIARSNVSEVTKEEWDDAFDVQLHGPVQMFIIARELINRAESASTETRA